MFNKDPEHRERIIARLPELWTKRVPVKQIEYELGITHNTLSAWRRRLGLPPRSAKAQDARIKEVRVMLTKTDFEDITILAKAERIPRTILIRRAIRRYLSSQTT